MSLRRVIEVCLSGAVVYTLMVACSGGGAGGGVLADAASDVLGAGGVGGLLGDVLSDPVSEAQAAPPPEIKEAACVGTPGGYYNAEVAFPGRTVNELARAAPLLHYATPQANGYDWGKTGSFAVKDGFIYVYCYYDSPGAVKVDGVRVVLPLG